MLKKEIFFGGIDLRVHLFGISNFLDQSSLRKLSLGDARAYHLSTAKNELGVVSAESTAGKDYSTFAKPKELLFPFTTF